MTNIVLYPANIRKDNTRGCNTDNFLYDKRLCCFYISLKRLYGRVAQSFILIAANKAYAGASMQYEKNILVIGKKETLSNEANKALASLGCKIIEKQPEEIDVSAGALNNIDVALFAIKELDALTNDTTSLLHELQNASIGLLVFTNDNKATAEQLDQHMGFLSICQCASNESPDMIAGRLATLLDIGPLLAKQLPGNHTTFSKTALANELDQEMKMAAKLQRDFLPKTIPSLPGLSFSTTYRPATFTSGDMYDIMRLDETHVAFYVADVVGHGLPAALLTIFIKQAIVTKRITNNNYKLIEPAEVLSTLNHELIEQGLSDFQFATCMYGILNINTLTLSIANAGHPRPMHIKNDGTSSELSINGPLLGVFPDAQYITNNFQLEKYDNLLIFSDGVEPAFDHNGDDNTLSFKSTFGDLETIGIEAIQAQLLESIEQIESTGHPRDDVTMIGISIKEK
jgi:hypothetical protein